MKKPFLIFILCALVGCTPKDIPRLSSPTGNYALSTEISGDEAGPTQRYCVRLKVIEVSTGKEILHQTGASDRMKWAAGWLNDTIVLYSSDIGTGAYDIANGTLVERPPNEKEKEIGKEAYLRKYGKKPKY